MLAWVAGESDDDDVEQLMQARGLTMAYMDNWLSVGVNGPRNHIVRRRSVASRGDESAGERALKISRHEAGLS